MYGKFHSNVSVKFTNDFLLNSDGKNKCSPRMASDQEIATFRIPLAKRHLFFLGCAGFRSGRCSILRLSEPTNGGHRKIYNVLHNQWHQHINNYACGVLALAQQFLRSQENAVSSGHRSIPEHHVRRRQEELPSRTAMTCSLCVGVSVSGCRG